MVEDVAGNVYVAGAQIFIYDKSGHEQQRLRYPRDLRAWPLGEAIIEHCLSLPEPVFMQSGPNLEEGFREPET